MELYVAIVSGLLAALLLWWKSSYSGKKRPPGPWGLPFVGYLPFLTSKPYLTFTRLAKRYGNIFTVRLGSLDMLILNDFQSTKEAFAQDAFFARPPEIPFIVNEVTRRTGAIFGMPYKEQRRQCLHMLRDLGLGKSKIEEQVQEEINELLEHFEKNVGKPFCIKELLNSSMSNNIASLMFGKRLKYDDPVRQKMNKTFNELAMAVGQATWLVFFPWLKKIFLIFAFGSKKIAFKLVEEMKQFIRDEVDEHEKTLDPNNVRDFIDGYLLEIKKRGNHPTFTKTTLVDLTGAFFGAGSETVRQTVEWLSLTVATDQNAQRRIQEEIEEVVGPNRLPIWPDHQKMPYTSAFIMELMRWRTLIPLNLLRYTVADTELNGYFIPKHTRVLSNHWAIHHDPEYWGPDAEEFRPERFLTEDGKQVKKWEHYIPFSTGKRACPGEPLGKIEIFLYFVSILQRFDVRLPDGKVANFDGDLGIGLNPKPQPLILTKRN